MPLKHETAFSKGAMAIQFSTGWAYHFKSGSVAAIDFSFSCQWASGFNSELLKIPQWFHPVLIFRDLHQCPETPLIFLKTLIGCVNEGATFPSCIHWIKRGGGAGCGVGGVIYNFGSCFQVSADFQKQSDKHISAAVAQRQRKGAGARVRFQTQ